MNRIDRLMAIALHLQGRRVTRAEDLARRFEVSLRTIYRDVSALSEAGVPVVAEAGVGYSLMKGYYLPPIMFTEDEAAALGMAAMALSEASDPSLEASIGSALLKVRAALPQAQKSRLERIEKLVTFAPRERGDAEPQGARLADVQSCLAEGRAMRIEYRAGGRQEASSRIVEPLGLARYLEKWHLIAWCRLRGDVRDFRLDRIERLEALAERSPRREEFDLQEYLRQQRSSESHSLEARVHFQALSVDRAKREWSLGLVDERRDEAGSVLTLRTGQWDWIAGWLLSFGRRVRVLEPDELRRMLADEARRLAEHHAGWG